METRRTVARNRSELHHRSGFSTHGVTSTTFPHPDYLGSNASQTNAFQSVTSSALTIADGSVVLGKGVVVIGGWMKRIQAVQRGQDDPGSDPGWNPWRPRF